MQIKPLLAAAVPLPAPAATMHAATSDASFARQLESRRSEAKEPAPREAERAPRPERGRKAEKHEEPAKSQAADRRAQRADDAAGHADAAASRGKRHDAASRAQDDAEHDTTTTTTPAAARRAARAAADTTEPATASPGTAEASAPAANDASPAPAEKSMTAGITNHRPSARCHENKRARREPPLRGRKAAFHKPCLGSAPRRPSKTLVIRRIPLKPTNHRPYLPAASD